MLSDSKHATAAEMAAVWSRTHLVSDLKDSPFPQEVANFSEKVSKTSLECHIFRNVCHFLTDVSCTIADLCHSIAALCNTNHCISKR
jgi:hypothetical protein